jgi:membrane associated rhomboid family serine protease
LYFFYYYPVGVDAPRPRLPLATFALAALCLALFLFTRYHPVGPGLLAHWAFRPAQADLSRALAAVFLHGGWLHLAGNLLYLVIFGPALERALGAAGLLLLYCGTGLLGNLAQGAFVAQFSPEQGWAGVVGASGAVSGLLGLFLVRLHYARVRIAYWLFLPLHGINRTGRVHVPSVVAILLWFALQTIYALLQGKGHGTAYAAHLGGFAAGAVLAFALGQYRLGRLDHRRARAQRARQAGSYHEAIGHLDRYLQHVDWDESAWLELARACAAARQWARAQGIYRELLARRLATEDHAGAAAVYLEARRGNGSFAAPPDSMRRMAFWLEKSTRFAEAASCYLDLARLYPHHPDREHALVRAATLLHSKLGDTPNALEVIDEALNDFPDGQWRPMLAAQRARLLALSR